MRRLFPALALMLVAATAVSAADDGKLWLDKMSRAVRDLNYEGTFVYLHGNQMETVRIIHSVDEQGERERLVSLNGAAREVIRDSDHVTCILPDSHAVVVDQSHPRRPFPTEFTRDLVEDLSKYYTFQVMGGDRVAGVSTRVIAIQPRDQYRYGYRMWLDKDTNLLLKSDLTDAKGVPIEQVMFTEFLVRDKIDARELEPALSGLGYKRHEVPVSKPQVQASGAGNWRVDRVPTGFMMTNHNRHFLPSSPDQVEHMVYSDGLATVSVFVEKPAADEETLQGISSMGAVNAYGWQVAGYQVTVVGEVPGATVEMIARSTRPLREATR